MSNSISVKKLWWLINMVTIFSCRSGSDQTATKQNTIVSPDSLSAQSDTTVIHPRPAVANPSVFDSLKNELDRKRAEKNRKGD